MTAVARPRRRYTINDVAEENSPHVYVYNRAPRETGTVSHILVPYTSSQTGDQKSFEIPMTTIPVDLADFAPKDELMRNPELRTLWGTGLIDFVPSDEARRVLDTDEALAEQDRLMAARSRRRRIGPSEDTLPGEIVASTQAGSEALMQGLTPPQPGEVSKETSGVNGAVLAAMEDTSLSEQHRLSLLKNLLTIMTDTDKRFVRGRTENPDIRAIVA